MRKTNNLKSVTNNNENSPLYDDRDKELPRSETYIERHILIGAITQNEVCEFFSQQFDTELLQSRIARKLVHGCLEYYRKYNKAPNGTFETLYFDKLRDREFSEDEAQEIEEDILPDLSQEYEQADSFNVEYLLERMQEYLTERNLELHQQEIEGLMQEGELDKAQQLADTFKPLVFEGAESKGLKPSELYHMEITQPKFLIEKLMPVGLTILAGKSNTGKSFCTMNMALSMARRKRVFEKFRSRDGQILYLSLEDHKARFIRRMRTIIGRNPDFSRLDKRLDVHFEWEQLNKGGLTRLKQWIEQAQKPQVIVIDTIGEIWSKSSKTSGAGLYAEEKRIFGELATLAHKYEISIILLHHTTKGYKSDPFDEILGGQGVAGSCDTKMVMHRKPNRPTILHIRSRDLEDKSYAFEVSEKGARWRWIGDAYEVQKTNEQQDIYDYVKEFGADGASFKDIKQACKDGVIDVSPNSINTILRKMARAGKLKQPKSRGKYFVPDEYQKSTNRKIKLVGGDP